MNYKNIFFDILRFLASNVKVIVLGENYQNLI